MAQVLNRAREFKFQMTSIVARSFEVITTGSAEARDVAGSVMGGLLKLVEIASYSSVEAKQFLGLLMAFVLKIFELLRTDQALELTQSATSALLKGLDVLRTTETREFSMQLTHVATKFMELLRSSETLDTVTNFYTLFKSTLDIAKSENVKSTLDITKTANESKDPEIKVAPAIEPASKTPQTKSPVKKTANSPTRPNNAIKDKQGTSTPLNNNLFWANMLVQVESFVDKKKLTQDEGRRIRRLIRTKNEELEILYHSYFTIPNAKSQPNPTQSRNEDKFFLALQELLEDYEE